MATSTAVPLPLASTDTAMTARSDITWTYDTLRQSLIQRGPAMGMNTVRLWRDEELYIDGMHIGLMCDGDPVHGDILLYSALGKPLRENTRALNRRLLEGNHLGMGTGGCTLGRHGGTGIVTLYARLAIPVTVPATLLAKVHNLKQVALIWRDDVHAGPGVHTYVN